MRVGTDSSRAQHIRSLLPFLILALQVAFSRFATLTPENKELFAWAEEHSEATGILWSSPAGRKKLARIMKNLLKRYNTMRADPHKTGGGKGTWKMTPEVSDAMDRAFG